MIETFLAGEFHFNVQSENDVIFQLEFCEEDKENESLSSVAKMCKSQIEEYFRGERETFSFPVEFLGTPFQKSVWAETMKIKFGERCSYQELAKRIGNEKATRAVANALRNNPIVLLCPCHRVIGKNGNLTGFMGGTEKLYIKRDLLNFEKSKKENVNS